MSSQANTASLVTNFNVAPYYDDFDESKRFHRLIFRPGLAVQARELTQMQTILQNQIDRFAENIFKEGSAVRGCEVSPLDTEYDYVKLRDSTSTGASVNVNSFLNKTIKGATSGVLAKVINVNDGSQANTPNFKTFFVDYISANTTTGYKKFANNEILTEVAAGTLKANTITAALGGATGYGSAITINSGILFAKDHFIRVDEQTIVLDKYTNTPSYRVGFRIDEEILSSADDATLLDPASGSYNYAAPGASRLRLTPVLTKYALTAQNANNFVEYITLKSGVIQTRSDAPQYAVIRDELAKRTREESGDYIVRGLSTRIREHYNNGLNQGVYTTGNTSQLSIDVEPGKAYVQGYDNELLVTQHVAIDKGIDFNSVNQASTYADYGNYIIVDNVVGNWDVNGQDQVSLRGFVAGSAQANAVSNRTYSSTSAPGVEIGKARVRGIEHYSGIPGAASAQYKMYLTDIRITTAGKSFANTESISFTATAGDGRADVLGSNHLNANTTEPGFNFAVFQLPAVALKRIRDSAGAVDSSYGFWKAFGAGGTTISFNTSGILSLDTTSEGGSSSETLSGSGVLSDALARANFHVVVRTAANTSTLTGTVSTTSGSNTVTGSGTAFTTQINKGDLLRIANTGSSTYLVTEVTSDTSLKVLNNVGATKTGMPLWKEFKVGQVLDMGGVGRDGDRSVNITGTTTATFDINETLGSTMQATIIAKLNKTAAEEADKTITRDRLVQLRIGTSGSGGYTGNTSGPWNLGLSDGFRLVQVRQKNGTKFTSTSEGTDVTSHFYLDDGQRDSHYDHARLVKKPTSTLTISAGDFFLVKVDHFTHSNRERGYFSIDSYPVNDTTAASNSQVIFTYEIPVFTSPTSGVAYDLRDCVDFRPRLTDSANSVTAVTNISTNPLGVGTPVNALSSANFDEPTGGLHFPYVSSLFSGDLEYYLPRKDLIVMTKDGNCESIRGVSSFKPRTPNADADKMTLAVVEIAPYPSLPDETARRAGRPDLANSIRTIKNERFTMRDIGAIRDRVERLEYYTTLSLLEKAAKDMLIRDANGNDRFKNGFLVDGFNGHAVGNVYDPDYSIAIDPSKKEGRPPAKIDNVELFYYAANSSNVVRTNVTTAGVSRDQRILISNSQVAFTNNSTVTSGGQTATVRYKFDNKLYLENATGNFANGATVTSGALSATINGAQQVPAGKLITLPYSHEAVVTQPFASTTRNAAGLFYNWVGTLTLDPNSDYWVDTVTGPDVLINPDNNADNWESANNAFGTQWGSWETVATGVSVLNSTEEQNGSEFDGSLWRGGNSGQHNEIGSGFAPRGIRNAINAEIISTGVTQQRVGTQMGITLSTQTQTVGSIVRDVNIQPFMRSREVKFTGRGFKPSSKLYAFFDSVDVSSYITPMSSTFANTANEGTQLYSDSNGNVYGVLRIPNSSTMRFRTGEKIFRLSDSPTNSAVQGQVTTAGQAIYASQGLTAQSQDLTVATTVSEVSTNQITETRTVQDISGVTSQVTPLNIIGWIDPIAQSFYVDTKAIGRCASSGAFITKIDLYFASKDATLPCIVELREVDPISGYPTPRIVPYSRVVVEPQNINTSDDGSKPTPIYFSSPVYVQDERDYVIVITPGGGSPNYSLWIARLGDTDILTGNRISSQPAAGMLFASSNDKTYTALQEEDLKFKIYFANFDVATTGSVVFKNEPRDFFTVSNVSSILGYSKAGEWIHGETYLKGSFSNTQQLFVSNNSTYVQGFVSGATGILTYYSTANGDLRLRNVTGAFRGGEAVRIRLQSNSGTIVGNSTGGIKFVQFPKGKMMFYDQVTSANIHLHLANVSYSNSGPATGTAANNRTFMTNRWIKGQRDGIRAKIAVIESLKADLINIKGDYITPSNTTVTPFGKFGKASNTRDSAYQNINLNADTEFTTRRIVYSYAAEQANSALTDKTLEAKFNFLTRNRYGSPVFDVTRISATTVETLLNNSDTNEANTVSGGSARAKYITRKMVLDDGQDAEDLDVYLEAYNPPGTNIKVYYKVLHREDSDNFGQARWIEMTQTTSNTAVSDSENRNDFRELKFNMPAYPTGAVQFASGLYANSSPTNILSYRNSLGAFYQTFKYCAIKVVLLGTNTTNPPRIRNLRALALQK